TSADFFPEAVYRYDTLLGTTTLVSGANGSSSVTANDNSNRIALSSDGGTVAFFSAATNLTAGQGDNFFNVFVYKAAPRTLTLASHVNTSSSLAAGGVTFRVGVTYTDVGLSGDGRFVTYQSTAGNIA